MSMPPPDQPLPEPTDDHDAFAAPQGPPSLPDGVGPTSTSPSAPPGFSAPAAAQPGLPSGYVAFGQPGTVPLSPTRRLRSISVWSILAAAVLSCISAAAQQRRLTVLDDFQLRDGTLEAIENMDAVVGIAVLAELLAIIVAGVTVMVWTFRTVRNAESVIAGPVGVKLATFGWIIPLGSLWLPFTRLRRVADIVRVDRSVVSWWQAGWIALTVFSFDIGFEQPATRDALASEANASAFTAVLTVAAAFVAQRAIRRVDDGLATRGTVN